MKTLKKNPPPYTHTHTYTQWPMQATSQLISPQIPQQVAVAMNYRSPATATDAQGLRQTPLVSQNA